MPSLHLKWTSCLLAVAFMFGIAGNALAATNPVTLKDLSQIVLGLKKEVDRLSKENKTLSKKLERIETQRYAARTPSSAYQIDNSERLIKARLSEPVRVASLGTTRVAEKSSTKETKAKELENRITALETKSREEEIRPYVRYDLAFGDADMNSYDSKVTTSAEGQPDIEGSTYPVSFGVGLRMSPSVRTDITLDYYTKTLTVPSSGSEGTTLSNVFVLGNVYYDFPSIGNLAIGKNLLSFAPYVGGGLGFSYFWGGLRDHLAHPSESLAGAAMLGLNVGLWGGLSADIGYRYAHLGFFGYNNKDVSDTDQFIRLQRHDLRMGLRYAF